MGMIWDYLRRRFGRAATTKAARPSETRVEFGEAELGGTDKIEVAPVPVTAGETLTVKYRGDLAGHHHGGPLTMHLGYGYGTWANVQDVPMEKLPDGSWGAYVTVDSDSAVNFCFTDGEHWDNNHGANWVYEVHNGFRI
jgi:hypothetical protein